MTGTQTGLCLYSREDKIDNLANETMFKGHLSHLTDGAEGAGVAVVPKAANTTNNTLYFTYLLTNTYFTGCQINNTYFTDYQ